MPPVPNFRRLQLLIVITLATAMVVYLAGADSAHAALRTAAGGGGQGNGGFDRFVTFVNRIADWTIPIGTAFSVLGLIWGGGQFIAGDTRAGRTLALVAVGLAVVLMSKPIAA